MANDSLTVYVTTKTKGWWRVSLLCWWIKLWKLQENVTVTIETRTPSRPRIEGAGKMLFAWTTVLAVLLSIAVGQWWR